jgi:hypothetical protein
MNAKEVRLETVTPHEARALVRRAKHWWQRCGVEVQSAGVNIWIEPRWPLRIVPHLLWIPRRRAILSVTKREVPYCVMVEGCDATKKWFADFDQALEMLVGLI